MANNSNSPAFNKDSVILNLEVLNKQYDKVMNISIYNRIKYGCTCYMCNDIDSCTCIQLSLFYKFGRYRRNIIDLEILKIKKQIEADNDKKF